MECLHCRGKMERNTAPFAVERNGYHIHWDSVPAWVCTQCGEPFFEEQEIERIQKVLAGIESESKLLPRASAQRSSRPA